MSVPKLRFPEFKNAGTWETKQLEGYLVAHKEKISADTNISIYSSTREGLIPQRDYYNGRELVNESEYGIVPNGFFVYRHMSDDGTFKFNINTTGGNIAVSKEYPVFSTKTNPYFLQCLLNESPSFESFAFMLKKGGTRTRLYLSVLKSWSTFLPALPEQQKIADCLSSLDDLIAAHKQKLDVLKTHKKGLMQQLFPSEGETVPRLRFPEFENAGEWKMQSIGDVFQVTRGEVLAMTKAKQQPLGTYLYPVYSSQTKNNGLAGFYSEWLFENAITWTTDGANAGEVNYRSGKFYCTNVCGVLLNNKGWANTFVAALLNTVTRKYVSYVGNPKLMNGVMSEIVIPLPSLPEQQKIADCLSSLDAMIAAQAEKIESFKVHKKGLMQQLFPQGEA